MKNRIIYLAGGNSSRFQNNKLLHLYHHKPLYQHTLSHLIEIVKLHEDYSLYVVTQYNEIKENIQLINMDRINVIYEPKCKKGLSYSIKAGILALEKEDAYDTFIVADQPFLKKKTLNDFMEQTIQAKKIVGCLTYQHKYYNPTMFHSSLEKELLTLSGDQGGKRILKQYLDDIYCYEIEDIQEIKDIDYPLDI